MALGALIQLTFQWPELQPQSIQCVRCPFQGSSHDFWPADIHKNGKTGRCKSCVNARRRVYKKNNRATVSAEKRRYYHRHRDREVAKGRAYRAIHPPKPRTSRSPERWTPEKREHSRAVCAARRARRKGAIVVELVYMSVLYARDNGICHICGEPCVYEAASRDHIIALCNGGEHSYANCALAHLWCNTQKGIQDRALQRQRLMA